MQHEEHLSGPAQGTNERAWSDMVDAISLPIGTRCHVVAMGRIRPGIVTEHKSTRAVVAFYSRAGDASSLRRRAERRVWVAS